MGTPIMVCRFNKAITDKEEFDKLVRDMTFNAVNKHYNTNPCNHSPECKKLSKEDFAAIYNKVMIAVNQKLKEPNAAWMF